MSASRCHFKSTLHILLTFHVGIIEVEIILLLVKFLASVDDHWREVLLTSDEAYHLHDILHAINLKVVYYGSLALIGFRYDKTFEMLCPCPNSNGQSSFYWLQSTVKTKLANHHIACKVCSVNLLIGC